jgi:hypothetical protein
VKRIPRLSWVEDKVGLDMKRSIKYWWEEDIEVRESIENELSLLDFSSSQFHWLFLQRWGGCSCMGKKVKTTLFWVVRFWC